MQLSLPNNIDTISENDQMRINHEKSEAKKRLNIAEDEKRMNEQKRILEERKIMQQKMNNSVITHDDNGGIIFVRNLNLDALPKISSVCRFYFLVMNLIHR